MSNTVDVSVSNRIDEAHRHDEFGFPIHSECDFKLKADKNASLPDTRSKGAQNSKQPTTLGLLRGNNLEN